MNDWKVIPGFPDYQVSSCGSVRRFTPRVKAISTYLNSNGYMYVNLRANGKQSQVAVHTVLLIAHVGPKPSPSHVCRHLDGCRTNNALSNLAWGTEQENQIDRASHGTSNRGERCGSAKLRGADVADIRHRLTNREKHHDIARIYGVSRTCITLISLGKRWAHV